MKNKVLLKNGVASLLSQSMRVLDQLVLIPFFLTSWGAAYYGEWITLTIIPAVLSFSDFGFSSSAGNFFVLSYSAGNYDEAYAINKTGKRLLLNFMLIAMSFTIFIVLICYFMDVFKLSVINEKEAIIAITILIFARLLRFNSHFYYSYFRASRRANRGINFATAHTLIRTILLIIILKLGYGIISIALVNLFTIVIFNQIYKYCGYRLLGFKSKPSSDINVDFKKQILKKGLSFLITPLWQVMYFQGTTLIVRACLGPESVAIFSTLRTLSRSVNQGLNLINQTYYPEVQLSVGKSDFSRVRELFSFTTAFSLVVAILGATFLYFFGLGIYRIWTNDILPVSNFLWNVLLIGVLFNSIWWNSEIIFNSYNNPRYFAFAGLFSAITSLLVSYLLAVISLKLEIFIIGVVLMDVIMSLLVIPKSTNMIGLTILDTYRHGFNKINRKLTLL